jgi:hypothetical protein
MNVRAIQAANGNTSPEDPEEQRRCFILQTKACFSEEKFCECGQVVSLREKDEFCARCWKFFPNEIYSILKNALQTLDGFSFGVTCESKSKEWEEVTQVTKTVAAKIYYGVLATRIQYEPNEWSSTPHDDYILMCTWFDNEASRNLFFYQMSKPSKASKALKELRPMSEK